MTTRNHVYSFSPSQISTKISNYGLTKNSLIIYHIEKYYWISDELNTQNICMNFSFYLYVTDIELTRRIKITFEMHN